MKVSNIARSLNEKVRLIKTENRLCRNLAREDLTDRINRFLTWEGAGVVDADTVLALDLGDLRKEYAKAREHVATVRDGSTGELAKGYWLCEVIAAHPYGDRILPLYGALYSVAAEGFESENAEMLLTRRPRAAPAALRPRPTRPRLRQTANLTRHGETPAVFSP